MAENVLPRRTELYAQAWCRIAYLAIAQDSLNTDLEKLAHAVSSLAPFHLRNQQAPIGAGGPVT